MTFFRSFKIQLLYLTVCSLTLALLISCATTPPMQEPLKTEQTEQNPIPFTTPHLDATVYQPPIKEKTVTETDESNARYVTVTGLNVRTGPGMEYSVTNVIGFRQKVRVLEQRGIWINIGNDKFVSNLYLSEYLPDQPNDPQPEALAEETQEENKETQEQQMVSAKQPQQALVDTQQE